MDETKDLENGKLPKSAVRAFTDGLDADVKHVILVTPPLTSGAAAQVRCSPVRIDHFTWSEVQINVTLHELVPKHEALTAAQQAEMLARYRVTVMQIPRVSTRDPVARYFGLRHGEVVKITSASETAGEHVSYRAVIDEQPAVPGASDEESSDG